MQLSLRKHGQEEARLLNLRWLRLRLKWPFTEWETGPTQKSRENEKENGKWPHARNGRKLALKMENGPFGQLFGHFRCGAGPLSIFFLILAGFCSGPTSHSVHGHFNHKVTVFQGVKVSAKEGTGVAAGGDPRRAKGRDGSPPSAGST